MNGYNKTETNLQREQTGKWHSCSDLEIKWKEYWPSTSEMKRQGRRPFKHILLRDFTEVSIIG